MTRVRLGAVGYLNARPHVFGLDRAPRFTLSASTCRRTAPSCCTAARSTSASFLRLSTSRGVCSRSRHRHRVSRAVSSGHASIPPGRWRRSGRSRSIRAPGRRWRWRASCARRAFRIQPRFEPHGPDLEIDAGAPRRGADHRRPGALCRYESVGRSQPTVDEHVTIHATSILAPSNGRQLSAGGRLSTVSCQRPPIENDRSRRGLDGDDRLAVRVCVLGRPGRCV